MWYVCFIDKNLSLIAVSVQLQLARLLSTVCYFQRKGMCSVDHNGSSVFAGDCTFVLGTCTLIMGMAVVPAVDGSWLTAITCWMPPVVASWGLRPITAGDVRMGSRVAVERIWGPSTVPVGRVAGM